VYSITGVGPLAWQAVAVATLGIGFVGLSFAPGPGTRRGVRLVPALGGVSLIGLGVLVHPDPMLSSVGDLFSSAGAVLVLVLVVALVAVLVDFVERRVVGTAILALSSDSERSEAWAADIGFGLVLLMAGVLVVVLVTVNTPSDTPSDRDALPPASTHSAFVVGWSVALPGSPLGVAFDSDRDALFVSLSNGDIVRYDLPPESQLSPGDPVVVASGLEHPRGLTVVDDTLVVATIGVLPCEPNWRRCVDEDVFGAADGRAGAVRILRESRGQVLAFDIDEGGLLSGMRVLVQDLPVADSEHGLNGMTTGPDGRAYLSIGHITVIRFSNFDYLNLDIEAYEAIDHPNKDLLGTVIRIDPLDGTYDVVASGMRNVYEIAFDPEGTLWGSDNDGEALGGVRREELLRIRSGADFGYPYDGSAPPFRSRTDAAAFTFGPEILGSGGAEWVVGVEGEQGLLLGSGGRVSFMRMADIDGAFKLESADDYRAAIKAAGWITVIESVGDRAAVFTEYGPNTLNLLSWGNP